MDVCFCPECLSSVAFSKKLINWDLIRFRGLIKPEMTIIVLIITTSSSGKSVNENFHEKMFFSNQFFVGFKMDIPADLLVWILMSKSLSL